MEKLNDRIEQKIKKIIKFEDVRYAGLDGLNGEMVKKIIRSAFLSCMRMGYNECSMLTQRSYRAIFKFNERLKKDESEEEL